MCNKMQTPNFEPLKLTGIKQKEKVAEIMKNLKEGLDSVFTSENYVNYLKVLSKFPNYSINNCLLISMQMPDATLVKGYKAWQKDFGRYVKKGERGIKIIAPTPYSVTVEVDNTDKTGNKLKDINGNPQKTEKRIEYMGFRVVTVFDVSQTDGKDLPLLPEIRLEDEVEYFESLFQALVNFSPVPVSVEPIQGRAKGYFSHAEQRIVVREGESELQMIKTLIHELAHAMLEEHQKNLSREAKEVEAESCAFAVCHYLGLDTSEYSFDYISYWSSSRKEQELKEHLDIIQTTVVEILDGLKESGFIKNIA